MASQGQSCRNFFKYIQGNDGSTEGLITMYLPLVSEHNLKVVLTVDAQLTSSYIGGVTLYKETSESAENLRSGLPLMYRVRFPLVPQLPKLSQIFHNDVSICRGEKETASFYTIITLKHLFKTDVNPSNSNIQNEYSSTTLSPDFVFPSMTYTPAPQTYYTTLPPYQPTSPVNQVPIDYFSKNLRVNQKTFQCGTRDAPKAVSLVINGIKASRTEFPWLVAHYHQRLNFICGGSLVSSRIVVSAAHCVWDKGRPEPLSPYESTYYMGKYKLYDLKESGYISSDVHSFVIHPKWKPFESNYDSDVAVGVLSKRIVFSDTIRPICLWTQSVGHYDLIGKKGVVAGWGITQHGKVSEVPMLISAPVVDDADCLRSNPGFLQLSSSTTFCFGDRSGRAPCQGDSGGAFAFKYGNQFYLRGLVSAAIINERRECSRNDYCLPP